MAKSRKIIPFPVASQTIGVHNQQIGGRPRVFAANGRGSIHANDAAANNRAETFSAADETPLDISNVRNRQFVVGQIETRQRHDDTARRTASAFDAAKE